MDLRYPSDVGVGAITACVQIKEFERGDITHLKPVNIITLYMPNDIKNPNTVSWEEGSERTLAVEAASGGLDAIGGMVGMLKGGMAKSVSDTLSRTGKAISGVAGAASSDLASYSTKTIQNPFTIMLFKSVGLREFSFEFDFYPKSQNEAGVIWNIVNQLKKGSLPKEGAGNVTLSYPNEYQIKFVFNGKPNPFMPKFKHCVITNIEANYTGQGVFAMTREGAPAEVKLQITFKEIEILTQKDYNDSMDSVSEYLNTMGVGYISALSTTVTDILS